MTDNNRLNRVTRQMRIEVVCLGNLVSFVYQVMVCNSCGIVGGDTVSATIQNREAGWSLPFAMKTTISSVCLFVCLRARSCH